MSNSKSLKALIDERFESDSLQLPVFNRVALELQKLKQSGNASIRQISDLIMKDQSLASRVLRLANSSFYGGLKQVETISAAVTRLGMNRVANLAMVASQLMAHDIQTKAVIHYMPELWRHSFVCATGGRWLAQQTGYDALAEEVFLAGLLHDIGELFLLKVLDLLARDAEHPVPMTKALVGEVLEAMHNDIGSRLLAKWELPEVYSRVARDHHLDGFNETDVILVITRLSDIVCHKLGIGCEADFDIVLAATPEAQVLGLREIKLAQLEVLLEDVVAEANALIVAPK
ncbi:HDOD domain-containing protein [Chromatium okenii]|uniref:HDOD domain-containing protein n=1 Tax=Chromatium okenii TaxID=61644 RepID=UPI001F5B4A02|nr:HDOD domain-containing protein [Chromatium okenii]